MAQGVRARTRGSPWAPPRSRRRPLITGCNVENASYGITLCAECALVSDAPHGGRRPARRVHLRRRRRQHPDALRPLPPAALRALGTRAMLLETVSGIHTIDEVLPDAFGPASPRRSTGTRVVARSDRPWTTIVHRHDRTSTASSPSTPSTSSAPSATAALSTAPDRLADRRLHARLRRGRADGRAHDGDPPERHGAPRDPRPDARDDRSGERWTSRASASPTVDKHSTGGVGDKITLPAHAAGRLLRRRRAAALRPRPRPHGRHARQARVDPRLARRPRTRRCSRRSGRRRARVDLRRRLGPRPRRRQALRAARHHGHGRGDPADRVVDHVARRSPRAPARSCST